MGNKSSSSKRGESTSRSKGKQSQERSDQSLRKLKVERIDKSDRVERRQKDFGMDEDEGSEEPIKQDRIRSPRRSTEVRRGKDREREREREKEREKERDRERQREREKEKEREREREREKEREREREKEKAQNVEIDPMDCEGDVHPSAAALKLALKPLNTKSSDEDEESKDAPHPAASALAAAFSRSSSSDSASSTPPPAHPMLAALQKGGGGIALRPVFKAGDFEKARLNKMNNASSPDVRAPEAEEGMDSVRQNAINEAKKCSKEATEIYPFLRVSGDWVARNKELLIESKVTHVLNMAHTVCKNYHEDCEEFEYLSLDVIDSANESITPFLLEAIAFIEKARKSGGCCYVHCHMGVSRSCTVVIAYVMLRDKLSFQDAFDMVKERRPVCSPNAGFIGQLQAWEKTLRVMPTRPHLYRVARHSAKDASLVVKLCYEKDSVEPVNANPNELDARGVFLLHDYASREIIVWTGPRCADPSAYRKAVRMFGGLMIDYLPSFEDHQLVFLDKTGPSEMKKFWIGLGVDRRDAGEMTNDDVDQNLDKYDEEYAGGSPGTSRNAERTTTPSSASSSTARGQARPNTPPISPKEAHSKAALGILNSPRSPKHAKYKVQLYGWIDEQEQDIDSDDEEEVDEEDAPALEWDRLRNYDSDDLASESMFILLVHDRQKAKKLAQGRRTIHKAFVWIGGQLEGRLNEDAGIAKANAFVAYCCERTKSPKVELLIEHDEKESDAFWEAFEAGF